MLESYRTLGAMVALDVFTVADVVRYSGVKENTARTVITRARRDKRVEDLGEVPTGRAGGRPKLFRVAPDKKDAILEALRNLQDTASAGGSAAHQTSSSADLGLIDAGEQHALSSLLAAEDTLLFKVPGELDEERRRELVEYANVCVHDAIGMGAEAGRRPHYGSVVQAHIVASQFLLALATSEQKASEKPADETRTADLRRQFQKAVAQAEEAGEQQLADDLRERFLKSRHAHETARSHQAAGPVLVVPLAGVSLESAVPRLMTIMHEGGIHFRPKRLRDLLRRAGSPRMERSSCLLAVPSGEQIQSPHELQRLLDTCRGVASHALVVSDQFSAWLNQEAYRRGLRYLAMEGLHPSGLLGALSARPKGHHSSPLASKSKISA